MLTLLEVLAVYLFLSAVAVSTAWALIARQGFLGLQQTNSPLARFFRTRFTVVKGPGAESNNSVFVVSPNTAPILATSVLLVTLVISCGGVPRTKSKHEFVPCNDESPMQASTSMPQPQVIE